TQIVMPSKADHAEGVGLSLASTAGAILLGAGGAAEYIRRHRRARSRTQAIDKFFARTDDEPLAFPSDDEEAGAFMELQSEPSTVDDAELNWRQTNGRRQLAATVPVSD